MHGRCGGSGFKATCSQVAGWRRKFHELHVVHASPTTTEALAWIGALYAIEEEIRCKSAQVRRDARQTRTRPLLDELRAWMENRSTDCHRKAKPLPRSVMRSSAGVPSRATSTMACLRSTTARQNGCNQPGSDISVLAVPRGEPMMCIPHPPFCRRLGHQEIHSCG